MGKEKRGEAEAGPREAAVSAWGRGEREQPRPWGSGGRGLTGEGRRRGAGWQPRIHPPHL